MTDGSRKLARRRPLAAENAALRETVERQRAHIALLQARLLRLHPRRRPRHRAWERLAILWHRACSGLSVSATARAFVLSAQTIVNWKRDVEGSGFSVHLATGLHDACYHRSGWPAAPFCSRS
jgi:hypothetical protein